MSANIGFVTVERADRSAMASAMSIMTSAFNPSFGEAWTLPQLSSMIDLPGSWLTLAKIDNIAAGFALSRAILDEAELLLIAVQPQWRKRSIGSRLLTETQNIARGRGIQTMHLEVRSTNDAIKMYKKAGFYHMNTRLKYYRGVDGSYHDALSFKADLT